MEWREVSLLGIKTPTVDTRREHLRLRFNRFADRLVHGPTSVFIEV